MNWRSLTSAVVWQGVNYLVPLLTFPYLARVLGVSAFGILGVGTAITAFALLVTDWGFSLSGTQAVAGARGDPACVNRTIWAIIAAKAALGLASSIAIIGGAAIVVRDPALRNILVISTLSIIASVLSVDWALRGLEQFAGFAAASVAGRLTAIPLIYLLVHDPSQVPQAAFALAAGSLMSTAMTLALAWRAGILRRPAISVSDAVTQFRAGTHLFLSVATISLYTDSLAIVLGATTGTQQVGFYSGANKIRTAVQSLLSPIGLVSYPRVSYLAATDRKRAREVAFEILRVQSVVAFVLALVLCGAAPLVVHLLLGEGFDQTILVLRFLSWLVFIVGLNNALSTMIMVPFGMKREVGQSTLAGAVLGLGLAIPLSYLAGAIGAAVAAVAAEMLVTSMMVIFVDRRFRPSWNARESA